MLIILYMDSATQQGRVWERGSGIVPESDVLPLVYGYLRAEEPDERELVVLRKEMNRFCAAYGYRLGAVFCDRGVPGDTIARTGFTGLLDVLQVPGVHGVVVPTLGHMSSHELVRKALVRMVERAGAQLIVVAEANGITGRGARDDGRDGSSWVNC